ncbi:hypothetical protein N9M39_00830 [Halieaceae bacterium]|nr:hypothetical protein [Halieaceae bacterium]
MRKRRVTAMIRACLPQDSETVSEMAIVDTFTKLIFGEDDYYSSGELLIIQALRVVDHNLSMDGHREMGNYLRALGVGEMIKLVSRVQGQLASAAPVISRPLAAPVHPRHA